MDGNARRGFDVWMFFYRSLETTEKLSESELIEFIPFSLQVALHIPPSC